MKKGFFLSPRSIGHSVCLMFLSLGFLAEGTQADNDKDLETLFAAYDKYEEYQAAGDLQSSMVEARTAYQLGKKLFGKQSEDTANLGYNYGFNLVQVSRFDEADEVLSETLDTFEKLYGEDSIELLPILMALGKCNAHNEEHRVAEKYFERALKLSERNLGKGSVNHAWNLSKAGADLLNLAGRPKGEDYLEDGYKILLDELGESDRKTAFTAYHLGTFKLDSEDYDAARELLNASLESHQDKDHPASSLEISAHEKLVEVYEEMNDREAATAHCLAVGRASTFDGTSDFRPIYAAAPEYPRLPKNQGREGFATVRFDVDQSGFAHSAEAVDIQGHDDFGTAAVEAVKKLRYAPRFKDGEPVPVIGVEFTFVFRLDDQACGEASGTDFVTCLQ